MLRESKIPLARLHALWSLEGLAATERSDVELLRTLPLMVLTPRMEGVIPQPSVSDDEVIANRNLHRHAMLIAERHGWQDAIEGKPPRLHSFGEVVTDFQFLLSFKPSTDPESIDATLAGTTQYQDPHLHAAGLIHFSDRELDALLFSAGKQVAFEALSPSFVHDFAEIVGTRGKKEEIEKLLAAADANRKQVKILLAGLSDGLRRSRKSISAFATDDETKRILNDLLREAAREAVDAEKPLVERIGAVRYLAQGAFGDVRPVLESLLAPAQEPEIQTEAVRVLAGFREPDVAEIYFKRYRELSPSVRTEVVESLASRADRHAALLDAVERKQVAAAEIPQARRLLIVRSKDPAIGPRAEKLFNASTGARREVVERYKQALKLAADAGRGQVVFLRECKACHKLRDQGFEVGPNLATVLHRTPDELLTHILDPNREVSPNYVEYVVELDDGRTVTGLVSDDTATGLTLRKAENVRETVLRRNIEAMYATGKSLMPEGMEQKLTPQDAADLVAFLLNRK
jgi:putative heme-binding domain-containing protein